MGGGGTGGGMGSYVGNYGGGGGNNNFLSYLGVPDQNQFTGGTPLLGTSAMPNVKSNFPLKKPGVPWDPNTDWYGYPMQAMEASTQFPPPQNFFGQGTKML